MNGARCVMEVRAVLVAYRIAVGNALWEQWKFADSYFPLPIARYTKARLIPAEALDVDDLQTAVNIVAHLHQTAGLR